MSKSTRTARLRYALNLLGPFCGLLLVISLFCIKPDVREVFLTGGNFKVIFIQTVIVAVCALGMTMIIVSGGIDLSVGSVVALASVIGARLLELKTQEPPVVISPVWIAAATIMAAAGVGLLNGSLVAGFRMLPFIVTLGMMGIARGVAKWMSGNQIVTYDENASLNNLMALEEPFQFFPLPAGVWMVFGLALVTAILMQKTVFGRHLFAIGSNEATARLCGVRVRLTKVMVYTLAGVLFGVGGLLQLSRLTVGDPSVAVGLELDVIAAVVIGGASLSGGTGSVLGSMLGALTMAVLRNGSSQMGWPNYMQDVIIGGVIILAVGLDQLRQRSFNKQS